MIAEQEFCIGPEEVVKDSQTTMKIKIKVAENDRHIYVSTLNTF